MKRLALAALALATLPLVAACEDDGKHCDLWMPMTQSTGKVTTTTLYCARWVPDSPEVPQ